MTTMSGDEGVPVGFGVEVGVEVGVAVGVGVPVGVAVVVGIGEDVGVGAPVVLVGVGAGVPVGVGEGAAVAVGVGPGVIVPVGCGVAEGVVAAGTGAASRCARTVYVRQASLPARRSVTHTRTVCEGAVNVSLLRQWPNPSTAPSPFQS
jgi:hypothetical protein